MKRRRIELFCFFLSLVLMLSLVGCGELVPEEDTGERESESTSRSEWWTEEETEAPEVLYDYATAPDEAVLDVGAASRYLLLVNREHPLGNGYIPDDLIRLEEVPTTYPMDLEVRTATALAAMLREMAADGVDCADLSVTSAYRSYRLQSELFEGYVEEELNCPEGFSTEAYAALGAEYIRINYLDRGLTRLTDEDAFFVVRSYSAEAGQSEHQTGLCVDFITDDMNDSLTVAFEEKEEFRWLSENAYQFGFILRYPKGKESVTGYTYEPWHYRFVGREAATEIYLGGLTLEEYLAAN